MRLEYGYIYTGLPVELIGTETGAVHVGYMWEEAKAVAAQDHAAELLIGPPQMRVPLMGIMFDRDFCTLKWPMVRIHYNWSEVDEVS